MSINFLSASTNHGFLDDLSKLTQIAFWSVTSLVAALSYKNAKRTIFQPLRTEIFKKQIEDLSTLLGIFTGKGEGELRADFDMEHLWMANVAKMYDAYLQYAFDTERPEEIREYRHEKCPSSILIMRPDAPVRLVVSDKKEADLGETSAPKPEEWDYEHVEIPVPRGYSDHMKELQNILDSPLLPSEIAEKLETYIRVARGNIRQVRDIINKSAPEMPQRYPKLEDMQRAKFHWIRHRLIRASEKLEPSAKDIVQAARSYFDSDNLLPRRRKPKIWLAIKEASVRSLKRLRIALTPLARGTDRY
ncbi:hypothetical protein [Streptomyces sp. SID2888]|uniref:hypothetical protein n=1 Tax=Streptomyces sp. SID2888 TaxID=2690256 RepID=UPI00136BD01A|nr:hypothetical protein [Streptomyces sp. SID2888]MYV47448.1 hypothetical protein [Streptomyces sp. SID2888]